MMSSVVARALLRRSGMAASHIPTSTAAAVGKSATGQFYYSTGLITKVSSSHTDKWMQSNKKSPQELIAEVPPIENDGRIAVCYGGVDASVGHPAEYINLDGSTTSNPAICKYCGLRYFLGQAH